MNARKQKIGFLFMLLAATAVLGIYITILVNFHQHKIYNKALIDEAFPLIKPKTKELHAFLLEKCCKKDKVNLSIVSSDYHDLPDVKRAFTIINEMIVQSEPQLLPEDAFLLRGPPQENSI